VTLVNKSHEVSAALIRPFSTIRGAGRLARFINSSHLTMGASPIKTARFRDGAELIVDLRSQTECYSFYSGLYDDENVNILKRLVQLGGNVLDVGSHIGFYCVRIARSLVDTQTVFCFEPLHQNYTRLQENIKLNNLTSRINVFDFGLSDRECTVDITLREDFQSGSATGNAAITISPEADQDFQKEKVKLKRLDDLIQSVEFGNVRVVKVDIEGHEDFFLAGAQKFIELQQPIIFCEINKPYYRWRAVDLDETFRRVLPNTYSVLRIKKFGCRSDLEQVQDLNTLKEIENVFFCSDEALDALHYAVCYQT
jgi:FkbM family methyltransferase